MDSVLAVVIGCFLFAIGVLVGAEGVSSSWTKDCQAIGMHRAGGDVYVCSKK